MSPKPPDIPGIPPRRALVGALEAIRLTLGDGLDALCLADTLGLGGAVAGDQRVVHRTADSAAALAHATGLSASGLRTAVVIDPGEPGVDAAFAASGSLPLPLVVLAVHQGDTDAIVPLARHAGLVLSAQTVPEAVDLVLVAHAVAEQTLLPALCLLDRGRLIDVLRTITLPAPAQAATFLQASGGDAAARTMLLGPESARVPRLIDPARPLGLGPSMPGSARLAARAGRAACFDDPARPATYAALERLSAVTGRRYRAIDVHGTTGARAAVVAQGPVVAELRAAADAVSARTGVRMGVVGVRVVEPFPHEEVRAALQGIPTVTVLDASAHVRPQGHLLLDRVRAALTPSVPAPEAGLRGRLTRRRADTEPRLCLAATGGTVPSRSVLEAICRNMTAAEPREAYFAGVDFEADVSSLPVAERTQQQVRRAWPGAVRRGLSGASEVDSASRDHTPSLAFFTALPYDGPASARVLAEAIFETGVPILAAFSVDARAPGATTYSFLSSGSEALEENPTGAADVVAVAPAGLIRTMDLAARVRRGGAVVLPDARITGIPVRVREGLRSRGIDIHLVGARALAEDLTEDTHLRAALATQVLAGAAFAVSSLAAPDRQPAIGAAAKQLTGAGSEVAALLEEAFAIGMRSVARADLTSDEGATAAGEPRAPWPVRKEGCQDDTLFSTTRFWETTGYRAEYATEEAPLPDPYLAANAMPPATSAAHRVGAAQSRVPRFHAERCTACGACWTLCPESALPATVQPVSALLDAAVETATASGPAFTQFGRAAAHVARQAHRLFASDELMQYTTVAALFDAAFETTAEKMGLREAQRDQLDAEYARVRAAFGGIPLAKTDAFFRDREKAGAGSGLTFALTIDADACKSCGICTAVCPEGALDMEAAGDGARSAYAENLEFLLKLPPPPEEALHDPIHRLLPHDVYHTLLGGDNAVPGSGPRIAVHLLLSAAAALQRPAWEAYRRQVADVRRALQDALQGMVTEALTIDDFSVLTGALSGASSDVDLLSIVEAAGARTRTAGDDRLKRLSARHQDVLRLEEALGTDTPASAVAALGGSAQLDWQRTYPLNPHRSPWLFHLSDTAPAVLKGMFAGQSRGFLDGIGTLRRARLEVDGTYMSDLHDATLEALDWPDLAPEERAAFPAFVLITDRLDQGVLGLLRSQLPVRVLVVHPRLPLDESPLLGAAAFAPDAFVLQSSIGTPEHLLSGFFEGFSNDGPALFSIYAPEPAAEEIAPHEVIDFAALAVQSRAFPLFTVRPGAGALKDRLSLAGNDSELDEVAAGCTPADWAARVGRLRADFSFRPKRSWHNDMFPLADYLTLSPEKRAGAEPYVTLEAGADAIRKSASLEMVAFAERRLHAWRVLQELAGLRSEVAERRLSEAVRQAREEVEQKWMAEVAAASAVTREQTHAALTARLMTLVGAGRGSNGTGSHEEGG